MTAAAAGTAIGNQKPNASATTASPKHAAAKAVTPSTASHGAQANPSSEPPRLASTAARARPISGTGRTRLPVSTDCTAAAWTNTPGVVPPSA